jgi:hypothetical protein
VSAVASTNADVGCSLEDKTASLLLMTSAASAHQRSLDVVLNQLSESERRAKERDLFHKQERETELKAVREEHQRREASSAVALQNRMTMADNRDREQLKEEEEDKQRRLKMKRQREDEEEEHQARLLAVKRKRELEDAEYELESAARRRKSAIDEEREELNRFKLRKHEQEDYAQRKQRADEERKYTSELEQKQNHHMEKMVMYKRNK